jgi:hypothetical protein
VIERKPDVKGLGSSQELEKRRVSGENPANVRTDARGEILLWKRRKRTSPKQDQNLTQSPLQE